jgi:Tfp pilus assembly protein PilF/tRNA A-37 threonylcarbamoyl transferase component Bud32
MTPDDWQQVGPHFYAALDLPPPERDALLRKLEATDPEIASAVRRLLAANENNDSFLKEPVWLANPGAFGPEPWSIEIGAVLAGRFKVLSRLGRGGFGEVYEAFDHLLDMKVALKTLRPQESADPGAREKLKKELKAAVQVQHSNVCRLIDLFAPAAGECAPVFFTMELLRGETLAERIKRGPIPTVEALDIVKQLINGLAAAHEKGIVHRDLKPGNIMLAAASGAVRVVIMDFGLAREVKAAGDFLETQSALAGTPPYISPEQLLGQRASAQSDIHALGAVMFETITGRRPFEGESPFAIAAARLNGDAPSPRQYVKDLDPHWEAAILACLERDPASRPASVFEILSLLETGVSRGWPRRTIVAAALGGLSAAAAGVMLALRSRPSAPRSSAANQHWKLGLETASRVNETDYRTAIDEFRQALAIEPNAAIVWADLAGVYAKAYNFEFFPTEDLLGKAREASRNALARNDRLAIAHGALAFVRSLDLHEWPDAEPEFQKALALGQDDEQIHSWYGLYLMKLGRFRQALKESRLAVDRNGTDYYAALAWATVCFVARDLNQLEASAAWLIRYDKDKPNSHFMLARYLEQKHDLARAEEELSVAERLDAKATTVMLARASLALTGGRVEQAVQLARAVEERWAKEGAEVMLLAGIFARTGDKTRAFQILEKAYAEGKSTVLSLATNPNVDALRDDARYPPLLTKIGFTAGIICQMDDAARQLQSQIMQQMGLSASSCVAVRSQPMRTGVR